MRRLGHLPFGLETDEPVTAFKAHGAVLDGADDLAGFAEAHPAESGWQLHPPIVDLAVFLEVDEPNAVSGLALFLEARALRAFHLLEIPLPGGIQVFELLLQVVGVGLFQPFGVRLPLPGRDPLGHRLIPRHVLAFGIRCLIALRQGLVPDKPGVTTEHPQAGTLRVSGIQSEFEALAYNHRSVCSIF